MANKLYEESDIQAIATAIRGKNGSSNTYKVSQMAAAIQAIPTGITPSGNKALTPKTTAQTNIDVSSYATASVAAVTSAIDSDIQAGNIKSGVEILGVTGTYTGEATKNVQSNLTVAQVKNKTSMTATTVTITVSKAGTYKCQWVAWSYATGTSSQNYSTQLYKNGSAVGSSHYAYIYSSSSVANFVVTETLTLAKNDVLVLRARTRSGSNYYTTCGMLVITEQ